MMPLSTSSAMPIAVVAGGEHDGLGEDARHQVLAVDLRIRRIAGQRDRATEDEREEQHEHDRLEDREDRELRDARDALEVAPADDEAPSRSWPLVDAARSLAAASSSTEAWPVSDRNTSSRVGRRRAMSSICTSRLVEVADDLHQGRAPPLAGTVSLRVCSSSIDRADAAPLEDSPAPARWRPGRGRRPRRARHRPAP